MAKITSSQIRNIALIGHGGDGKTSLAEAMLYLAKATDRLGKPADGNTVCDFDPEEKKRTISVSTSVANFMWNNKKINILDAPGYFDFVGEMLEALSVAGTAVLVVDGKSGHKVGTEIAWDNAGSTPKAFFVNKIDDENSDFAKTLAGMREAFGTSVCPVFVPFGKGASAVYYNLLTDEAFTFDKAGNAVHAELPAQYNDAAAELRHELDEALAETSEELMEKLLILDEPLTHEEKHDALNAGLQSGAIAPVFAGSATTLAGVKVLMDTISASFSSPYDRRMKRVVDGSEIRTVEASEKGAASVFVFKTVIDQFGKKTYFQVRNGVLKKDSVLTNLTNGQAEKISRICTSVGAKDTDTDELVYGDIGVTVKLVATNTGDTLTADPDFKTPYEGIKFPTPYLRMAIAPKSRGDEDKISSGISKLLEEDYTIKYENDAETKQMCLYGLGDVQLDVITSKLKNRFGVSVELTPAKVPYRETIKKTVQVQGKHKKQSGGHGQYGDVRITFSHGDTEELQFSVSVVGGSVPKNFHPSVEKGLQNAIKKGTLAGYPVINLKADLYDGSYHDVDSNDMSFQIAASLAFKEGMKQGGAVLLEPYGTLRVFVPNDYVGDVIGDVTKRRGRIVDQAQGEKKGQAIVEAECPMAEMGTYAIQLRAMTQGRGSYTYEFTHYEEAPADVTAKVVAEAKKDMEEE